MISKENVRKLAGLARIKLTPAEEASLAADMENILGYVKQIQEVSASQNSDTKKQGHPAAKNVLRADGEPHKSGEYTEDLLAAAPARQGQYVKVKKIL